MSVDLATLLAMTEALLARVAACDDAQELEQIRLSAFGRKGDFTQALKALGSLPADERPRLGEVINQARAQLTQALETRTQHVQALLRQAELQAEAIDVSLPAYAYAMGSIHPISQVIDEAVAIFTDMGFMLAEGPDIESDSLNFTALNFPDDHPARDMHDTFYVADSPSDEPMLLRTHTSPVQVRAMRAHGAPIRVIAPGRTYRSDHDMTHSPMFHQIEGVVLDRDINFAHLKGCLIDFCRCFFEIDDLPLRFRPSFFPFTEPSAEVDIGCQHKDGRLEIGAGQDWMEILGCGMMHPNVIKNGGLDPSEIQGFAFGFGVERLAMLKYGLPDLRPFFDGDQRWAKHYGFSPLEFPDPQRGLRV